MKERSMFLLGWALIFQNLVHPKPAASCARPSSTTKQSTEETPVLTSVSHTILHLFYTAKHLRPVLEFIKKKISESAHVEAQCAHHIATFFAGTGILKSQKIKNVFSHLEQTDSLAPLIQMWDHVQQFRYGLNPEEKNILLDFSKMCLVAYQALLMATKHTNESHFPAITPDALANLEIDQVLETMEECSLSYFLKRSFQSSPIDIFCAPPALCVDEFCASFTMRYYLIKRLTRAFSLLSSFHEKKISLFVEGIEHLGFKKGEIIFDDQVISGYFDLLQEEKRLDPLIQLIGQFKSFDFIRCVTFIKEFLVLLCIIYKDLVFRNTIVNRSTETIKELHALSIEQLLALIDTINEKYTQKSFSPIFPKLPLSRKNFLVPQLSIPHLIQSEYGLSSDTFTTAVFHRYYYVKRLEEVVKILLKLASHNRATVPFSKSSLLLKPLAMAWEDFIAYKDICDQKLINDFAKEIFVLSQTISHTTSTTQHNNILQAFLLKEESYALQQSLAQKEEALENDFKSSIEINKVITRFYLLRRLEPILAKIQILNLKDRLYLGCTNATADSDPCLHYLNEHHGPVAHMIHTIYYSHSFKPLFNLWHGLSRYKYIQNDIVSSNFARFITHLLHNTATHHATHLKQIVDDEKAFMPLEQLQDMPLEDILNLLDVLVEELPDFLAKNEISSTMKWKDWIKKYWLIAPISTIILGIRVYMIYKGMLEKSNHRQTQPSFSINP